MRLWAGTDEWFDWYYGDNHREDCGCGRCRSQSRLTPEPLVRALRRQYGTLRAAARCASTVGPLTAEAYRRQLHPRFGGISEIEADWWTCKMLGVSMYELWP